MDDRIARGGGPRLSDHAASDARAIAFVAALRDQARPADCARLFRATIAPLGFDTFACGALDTRDHDVHVFYIIDWPDDWRRFYLESGFMERDPLLAALDETDRPFTWSDLRTERRLSKAGTEAISRCAERGWTEGLVIPIAGVNSRNGLVSMVGRRDVRPEDRAYLILVSTALYHHVRNLAPREGFAIPPMGLTEREIAAIACVAQGQSDAAIGASLGVAKTTAHEFVEKARRKLKARSRAELVAIATAFAIIDL